MVVGPLIFRQGKWGGFLYGLWNWIHFASFTFLLPSPKGEQAKRIGRGANRAERIHAIRRNPHCRQRQAEALKILASGRSVERWSGENPVSRRNQWGRLCEIHTGVRVPWVQMHGRKVCSLCLRRWEQIQAEKKRLILKQQGYRWNYTMIAFLYIKTKPFVYIRWYYHPNFVQKVESQKTDEKDTEKRWIVTNSCGIVCSAMRQ